MSARPARFVPNFVEPISSETVNGLLLFSCADKVEQGHAAEAANTSNKPTAGFVRCMTLLSLARLFMRNVGFQKTSFSANCIDRGPPIWYSGFSVLPGVFASVRVASPNMFWPNCVLKVPKFG